MWAVAPFALIINGYFSNSWISISRFNSSLRYCDYRRAQGERVVVVVISEDGMVDILPKLNPILKRKDVENIVSTTDNIKVIENGYLQILLNGVKYNAEGKVIQ